MTHSELCELSCKRFIRDYHVGLWEYQSFSTSEFPDVLLLGSKPSMLLEIKTSRSDFLKDSKKEARKKYSSGHIYNGIRTSIDRINNNIESGEYVAGKKVRHELKHIEIYMESLPGYTSYVEKPHLGALRYFVCEEGVINIEDLPEAWGLIWFRKGKFYTKKQSGRFRQNMMAERDIVIHAIRKMHNNGMERSNIIVRPY